MGVEIKAAMVYRPWMKDEMNHTGLTTLEGTTHRFCGLQPGKKPRCAHRVFWHEDREAVQTRDVYIFWVRTSSGREESRTFKPFLQMRCEYAGSSSCDGGVDHYSPTRDFQLHFLEKKESGLECAGIFLWMDLFAIDPELEEGYHNLLCHSKTDCNYLSTDSGQLPSHIYP